MKTVRLENNIVVEIIPAEAMPVVDWYGEAFAAQCVEAPDTMTQGMVYDAATGTFSAPETPTKAETIAGLKAQLEATDYKIIKCSEYNLVGLTAPYDIAALHAERQTLRDQINILEATL